MNNDFNNFNAGGNDPEERGTGTAPDLGNTENTAPANDAQNDTPAASGDNAGAEHGNEGSFTYTGSYGQGGPAGGPYNNRDQGGQFGGWNNNRYGGNGGWNPSPHDPYAGGTIPPFTPPPKKEKKSGGIAAALVITMVVSVILSAAAGFGGAYLYNGYFAPGGGDRFEGGYSDNDGDDTTVLHRVVETDESTSTGEKGVYTDVAAIVKDSVVEITTEFKVTGFFQYISEGAGSGVIISEDGYIITNNHVISDSDNGSAADKVTVRLTNGKEYKAKLVGRDEDYDIAVIKIEPDEKLSFAVFGDSDKLTVGEEVIAVGNPLGELGGTVTNGIISALDRDINVDGTKMNLLQTNAAINPGNSGGGLFNMKGELVGVVNAKSSGSGIEGLGFAIPANDAYDVAEQLMESGYVKGKVYLGISCYDVTDAFTAYRYFKSQATGVYVVEVEDGYNDDVLKYGDRIIAVNGDEITKFSQIKDILKSCEVGDELKFSIQRSGKLLDVTVICYEYVPEEADIDFDSNK